MQVKRALQAIVATGTHNVVVDLERCPMMDSTFLGTLTGAALSLRDVGGGGSLSILNANQRNQQLLTSLGLDHILDLDLDGTAWPEERRLAGVQLANCQESGDCTREEHTQHVLQAHQTLCSVNEVNEGRFRDVIQFLEKELDNDSVAATP